MFYLFWHIDLDPETSRVAVSQHPFLMSTEYVNARGKCAHGMFTGVEDNKGSIVAGI
jgi:hypothetical protein